MAGARSISRWATKGMGTIPDQVIKVKKLNLKKCFYLLDIVSLYVDVHIMILETP